MSLLAVVAYPTLGEGDRQWIESVRAAHDPQAARLAVHFTLVFPMEAAIAGMAAKVSDVARSTAPIAFTIRRVQVVPDADGGSSCVFLVPDEGFRQILILHRRLSEILPEPRRRADVPYLPHMTIGAADAPSCDALARQLTGARTIDGTVEKLDLVDVAQPRVRSIGSFPLHALARRQ